MKKDKTFKDEIIGFIFEELAKEERDKMERVRNQKKLEQIAKEEKEKTERLKNNKALELVGKEDKERWDRLRSDKKIEALVSKLETSVLPMQSKLQTLLRNNTMGSISNKTAEPMARDPYAELGTSVDIPNKKSLLSRSSHVERKELKPKAEYDPYAEIGSSTKKDSVLNKKEKKQKALEVKSDIHRSHRRKAIVVI